MVRPERQRELQPEQQSAERNQHQQRAESPSGMALSYPRRTSPLRGFRGFADDAKRWEAVKVELRKMVAERREREAFAEAAE